MKKYRWNKNKFKRNMIELLKVVGIGLLFTIVIFEIYFYGLYLEV